MSPFTLSGGFPARWGCSPLMGGTVAVSRTVVLAIAKQASDTRRAYVGLFRWKPKLEYETY